MTAANPLAIVDAIRREIDAAAETILSEAEAGLADLRSARQGHGESLDHLQDRFSRLMEACAFHDLTSQWLTVLAGMLSGAAERPTSTAGALDGLLNGPALPGGGLDQTRADQVFAGRPVKPVGAEIDRRQK